MGQALVIGGGLVVAASAAAAATTSVKYIVALLWVVGFLKAIEARKENDDE